MIPWFDASHITLLGHTLPTQGPLAIAGIAVGHGAFSRWLQRHHNMTPLRTDMLSFAIVSAAVIAGHLYALATTDVDGSLWQLADPQSSLGALLGGGIMGLALTRLWRLRVPVVIDAAAWGFAHGWPFVRLGCVLIHDHPGRASTSLLAVAFPQGPRLDIGLLEWLLCLILLALVHLLVRRPLPPGRLAGWATLFFATGRLGLEWLRVDDARELLQGPSLPAVLLCVIGWAIAAILWRISRPQAADAG
jgi:phosphatidylglycerol:prolipoprotein diacylglycerol transferase